jgi:methionyl-tRNA formyltransferase
MRIVFMGTSTFAVPSLEALLGAGHQVLAVVTQPDRPRGRGKHLKAPPVKEAALQHHLPVFQPHRIKDREAINQVIEWDPELIVVAAYGQIIPSEILQYPGYGCINVHASLLPEYRGAAPIQRALMAGEKQVGVTIMYMNEGLDTGDIISQQEISISDAEDHGRLEARLASVGADLLIRTIADLVAGMAKRIPQDEKMSHYAPRITPDEEKIDWLSPAIEIHNLIRALGPEPAAYFSWEGQKVKVFRSRVVEEQHKESPGQIVAVDSEGFTVQTGSGLLKILEVQRQGKRRMTAGDFLRGVHLRTGGRVD